MPFPISSPARLQRLFLASSYVTYALACAALAWSEVGLITEIIPIAIAVGVLLVTAYVLEGRWALSNLAANVAGMSILGLAAGWITWRLVEPGEGGLRNLPFPTSMLPMAGPPLLFLLAAKLLRPNAVLDHWALQGIALLCVALGCTLADDAFFGVLMLLYIGSAIWCLALFYLYRQRLHHAGETTAGPRLPRGRQYLEWCIPVAGLTLLGFFSIPRSNDLWQLPSAAKKTEVGTSEEQAIDLNRTGTLQLDPGVAFDVYVEDRQGRPKLDIPADQRWRGPTFVRYAKGSWKIPSSRFGTEALLDAADAARLTLPDFDRDDQYTLTFTVKARLGQVPFVSDPLFNSTNRRVPVVQLLSDGNTGVGMVEQFGNLRMHGAVVPGKTRYRQVTVPPPAPDLSHTIDPNQGLFAEMPDKLPAWTKLLVVTLIAKGALPAEVLGTEIKPEHHEIVARALEAYLARSGEYTYSLSLVRADPTADPVEDFLFKTKAGHCNRFASALALMLRSLRIPCRVVMGYRGHDSRGDGHYEVRQCYAHSWVEARVYRREPVPAHQLHSGRPIFHWLTLDPTPAEAASTASAAADVWWSGGFDVRDQYQNLIMNYNAENRDAAIEELWYAVKTACTNFASQLTARSANGVRARIATSLVAMLALLIAAFVVRRVRRIISRRLGARAPIASVTGFHRRLLSILARQGWAPAAGQTSKEFALATATALRLRVGGDEMDRVVQRLTDTYYRVRFGAHALTVEERSHVNAHLDWLAKALSRSAD